MSRKRLLMATISAFAVVAGATSAAAAPVGTAAGTSITNTVTVDYAVNGVNQNDVTATDTFTVDRKLNVAVTWQDSAAVSAVPGQTSVVTTFQVANLSNDAAGFLLAVQQPTTDGFNATNVRIFVESDGVAGYSAGDELASSLAGLASGDLATVYVLADMIITPGAPPVVPTNAQTADVILSAQFASGVTAVEGFAGTGGTAITTDDRAAANVRGGAAQNVFADAAGDATGDIQYDGKHSDTGTYVISGANVTATKVSRVVSDGVSATNPKAIPGATIEYCIVVAHSGGTATASSITVSDPVPAGLTQTGAVQIKGPVAIATDACTAANTGTGSVAGNVVSGAIPNLTSGQHAALVFQATID